MYRVESACSRLESLSKQPVTVPNQSMPPLQNKESECPDVSNMKAAKSSATNPIGLTTTAAVDRQNVKGQTSVSESELPAILLTTAKTMEPTETVNLQFSERAASVFSLDHGMSDGECETLMNKYSELKGIILTIKVPILPGSSKLPPSNSPSMGLRLSGNRDLNQMSVFCCGIQSGSIVEQDGQIAIGDRILEVNGHNLYGLSHLNAAPIIRSAFLDALRVAASRPGRPQETRYVAFVIQRHEDNCTAMAAPTKLLTETHSARSSRRSSIKTVLSTLSAPKLDTEELHHSYDLISRVGSDFGDKLVERLFDVHLFRVSGNYGFLLQEVSSPNDVGIYVKQVSKGTPASKDGRLLPGDRIIQVNNRSIAFTSYNTVLDWIEHTEHDLRLQVSRLCRLPRKWATTKQLKILRKRQSAPDWPIPVDKATCLVESPRCNRCSSSVEFDEDTVATAQTVFRSATLDFRTPHDFNHSSHGHLSDSAHNLTKYGPANAHHYFGDQLVHGSAIVTDTAFPSDPSARYPADTTWMNKVCNATILQDLQPDFQTEMELKTGSKACLGIGFIGGSETSLNYLCVHEISINGAAAEDGRLRPGDLITQVNFTNLVGFPYIEAVQLIQTAFRNARSVESSREDDFSERSAFHITVFRPGPTSPKWYDQEVLVELTRKSGRGLGIAITNRYEGFKDPAQGIVTENGTINGRRIRYTGSLSYTSYGVVISEIIKGSLAATDGRLMVHDQILSVNDEDTTCSTSERVTWLLRSSNKVNIKIGRLKDQVILSPFQEYISITQ